MKAYKYYKKDIKKFIKNLDNQAIANPYQNDWIMDHEFTQNDPDDQNNDSCNENAIF
jgi:hypothetical protein